ncbi:MauE/DoxX family redox-associated membrane protein [Sphingobacterium kyonggiense]
MNIEMDINRKIIDFVSYAFILLWGYASITKLYNWKLSRTEMHMQIFPAWIGDILFWFIPLLELFLVLVLLDRKRVTMGLKLSTLLIALFTFYLLIGVTGFFGEPCICAGILKGKSVTYHIVFNMVFVIFGIIALVLAQKGQNGKYITFDSGRKEGSQTI